ncbi:MAG: hypothetical protein ACLFWF_06515 [Alphaproteobacteria bacterium]
MNENHKKRPDGDVKSRRELLAATAKLSAFLGAMGLAGASLNSATAARAEPSSRPTKVFPKVEMKRNQELLPAVQQRELKGLLRDAMRSGDTQAALKRHPKLKLNRRQETALKRMTRQDWASLRRLQAKLAPLEDLAAGDTGYVFW